eukprot:SAG11_NODE_29942_length_305_cov_1.495146_1_plen_72_part_10
MKALWEKNQGLQSRFAGTIHFPDFPPCTLTEIAVKMLASSQVYIQGEKVLPGIWEYVHRYRGQFKADIRVGD